MVKRHNELIFELGQTKHLPPVETELIMTGLLLAAKRHCRAWETGGTTAKLGPPPLAGWRRGEGKGVGGAALMGRRPLRSEAYSPVHGDLQPPPAAGLRVVPAWARGGTEWGGGCRPLVLPSRPFSGFLRPPPLLYLGFDVHSPPHGTLKLKIIERQWDLRVPFVFLELVVMHVYRFCGAHSRQVTSSPNPGFDDRWSQPPRI